MVARAAPVEFCAPVPCLRLRTTRLLVARHRGLHVDHEPGSVLLMSYETQIHYTHGIPKTKDPVGERISLAFRVKPKTEGGFYR